MSYYGYIPDPDGSYLEHYGVKGMKWGIRKGLQKYGHKIATRYTKINDFNRSARDRKHKIKGDWMEYDAKVYSGKIKDDKHTYRKVKRQYKKDLREANRDINNTSSVWLLPAQKEYYINSSAKKRKALNALYSGQQLAEMYGVVKGVEYASKKAYQKHKIKQAEKQYGLR